MTQALDLLAIGRLLKIRVFCLSSQCCHRPISGLAIRKGSGLHVSDDWLLADLLNAPSRSGQMDPPSSHDDVLSLVGARVHTIQAAKVTNHLLFQIGKTVTKMICADLFRDSGVFAG